MKYATVVNDTHNSWSKANPVIYTTTTTTKLTVARKFECNQH